VHGSINVRDGLRGRCVIPLRSGSRAGCCVPKGVPVSSQPTCRRPAAIKVMHPPSTRTRAWLQACRAACSLRGYCPRRLPPKGRLKRSEWSEKSGPFFIFTTNGEGGNRQTSANHDRVARNGIGAHIAECVFHST
jgi:hypothetical protein